MSCVISCPVCRYLTSPVFQLPPDTSVDKSELPDMFKELLYFSAKREHRTIAIVHCKVYVNTDINGRMGSQFIVDALLTRRNTLF